MNKKRSTTVFGIGLLFLAAILWGFGFTTQDMALKTVDPFTLNFIRNIIAGLFLIPCIMLFDKKTDRRLFSVKNRKLRIDIRKSEWIGGMLCGLALCAASTLQQFGIASEETDTGTAAFITSLYMIFVPLIGLFRKKFPSLRVWLCVIGALLGFYFLSAHISFEGVETVGGFFAAFFKSGFKFAASDLIVLACAVIFAFHIVIIDHFLPTSDGVRLSCIQVFTAGILSIPFSVFMLATRATTFAGIWSAILPTLYLGIFSSGIAYTAQIVGQKHVDVTVASIILSMESIFGALFGMLFLNETKTKIQLVGCLLVFAAVVISQLPKRQKAKKKNKEDSAKESTQGSENAN